MPPRAVVSPNAQWALLVRARVYPPISDLAEPMLPACIDFQDAFAAGLGVTEHARDGKAAQQIDALWRWTGAQFGKSIAEVEENVAVTGGSSDSRLNGACA